MKYIEFKSRVLIFLIIKIAEKKRVTFTIEQKKQIFERREQAPEESFTTIANFFTAKWGIKIDRSMACRWHKLFKDHKKGTEVNAADIVRSRLVPAIIRKFEPSSQKSDEF